MPLATARDVDLLAQLAYEARHDRDHLLRSSEAARRCGLSSAAYHRVAKKLGLEPADVTYEDRGHFTAHVKLWDPEIVDVIRTSKLAVDARARAARRAERDVEEIMALVTLEDV